MHSITNNWLSICQACQCLHKLTRTLLSTVTTLALCHSPTLPRIVQRKVPLGQL